MRVLFFGSPPFAAKILEDLLDHGITPVGVVTQPDRPAGRSMALKEPAVKQLAKLRVPHLPYFNRSRPAPLNRWKRCRC
jgi:methionyl-tRNA formyltransferase